MKYNNRIIPQSVFPHPLLPPYNISFSVLVNANVCGHGFGAHATSSFTLCFHSNCHIPSRHQIQLIYILWLKTRDELRANTSYSQILGARYWGVRLVTNSNGTYFYFMGDIKSALPPSWQSLQSTLYTLHNKYCANHRIHKRRYSQCIAILATAPCTYHAHHSHHSQASLYHLYLICGIFHKLQSVYIAWRYTRITRSIVVCGHLCLQVCLHVYYLLRRKTSTMSAR